MYPVMTLSMYSRVKTTMPSHNLKLLLSNELTCTQAGIAQLGEQQTEVTWFLEVPCSIHGPGIYFLSESRVFVYNTCQQSSLTRLGHRRRRPSQPFCFSLLILPL